MSLLKHEFFELASRPLLWAGTLVFCLFLLHAVGHLNVDEDELRVAFYRTQTDSDEMVETFRPAERLLQEMANVTIIGSEVVVRDLASQMLNDRADLAVTRTQAGWRITLMSRSAIEHQRLVRAAQLLGASISQQRPWFQIAYEQLPRDPSEGSDGWPSTVQISGTNADPRSHAYTFVPKLIALLSYFIAFAFACRSMIRDISNNTLLVILTAEKGQWLRLIVAKSAVSTMIGLVCLWALLLFAVYSQGFQIKGGLYAVTVIQFVCLIVSALLGVALSLMARTESRIYFIASAYLVLLVLFSGLIAKMDAKERVLVWISSVVPLGDAMDILSDWMFYGLVPSFGTDQVQILVALLILSVVTTYGSVLYFKRSI